MICSVSCRSWRKSDIKIRGFRLLVHNKVYAQFQLGAVDKVKQVASDDQTGSWSAEVDVISRED